MPTPNALAADLLQEYADLIELSGGDRFKVRAYERAARAIRSYPEDVSTLDERSLQAIPNVGKAIAGKVHELVRTGTITAVDELREALGPAEIRSLTRVPGLGPRNALRLYRELGVRTPDELRQAVEEGRLRGLRGFGPKAEQNILRGLERAATAERRLLLPDALLLAEDVLAVLREARGVSQAAYAGSLRRMCETIGDVDLLAAAADPAPVMDAFVSHGLVERVVARGDTRCSVGLRSGVQIDLRVVPPGAWGAALQYFTGSKEHNVRLRERALRMGLRLSEYGLERTDTGEVVASRTEEDVYAALGMQWIPPTLREDRGEVDAAEHGRLPRLLEVGDIRGDLQTHSTYSDGKASLRQMVMAAAGRGYEYYAVTDHGRNLTFMRERLTLDAMARQREEVDALNAELGGRMVVLQGVELNVGPDGELDYPDEILARFDVVVASVHSELRAPRERMTRRLVRAIENPHVHILGHPTNRRLGSRPESDIDLDAVFEAAARHGVAVEIDSLPERLDIRDEHIIRARRHGVRFTVDTDAHSVRELDQIGLGVAMAQRGWVTPDEVVNTMPLDRVRGLLLRGR